MSSISTQVSGDVIYRITRNRGAHVMKRGNFKLSKDPFNPTGIPSARRHSLSNKRVAAIIADKEGGFVLKKKNTNPAVTQKPNKQIVKIPLKMNDTRGVALSIIKNTRGMYYRADLTNALCSRASRIVNARLGVAQAPLKRRKLRPALYERKKTQKVADSQAVVEATN